MLTFRKAILPVLFILLLYNAGKSQCCSAGGGCPIAGGASTGVLQQRQFELNANYQYVSTTKFLNGDSPDRNFLDRYYSQYTYYRLGYGLTDRLTLSLESGYYIGKTQIGLNKRDTISTHGWADLIIFPRYNLLNRTTEKHHDEITAGLGIKVPLGNPKDTLRQIEPFSKQEYYILKPVAIRTTSGGQDLIFFLSVLHSYPSKQLRFFSNMLYIKKGWNKLGEKAGDYASIGFYASKTYFQNLGVTLQLKGEWIDKMQTNASLNTLGFFNYDPEATGSKKILIVPQLSYAFKSFNFYISGEYPLYQYVNKEQIASQYFVTTGISYRFIAFKAKVPKGVYYCPMHRQQTSASPGKCPECGMNLELNK